MKPPWLSRAHDMPVCVGTKAQIHNISVCTLVQVHKHSGFHPYFLLQWQKSSVGFSLRRTHTHSRISVMFKIWEARNKSPQLEALSWLLCCLAVVTPERAVGPSELDTPVATTLGFISLRWISRCQIVILTEIAQAHSRAHVTY